MIIGVWQAREVGSLEIADGSHHRFSAGAGSVPRGRGSVQPRRLRSPGTAQITSANVFSVRRKYQMPLLMSRATRQPLNRTAVQSSVDSPRNSAQRNPSITPTMGFNAYSKRHCSGTIALLNPTGDTYSPNCTMNGTM